MKKVIYTCITDGYDNLLIPKITSKDFDYICYTDDDNLKSDFWIIRKIPDEFLNYPKNKINRAVKILPHKILQEYDISIWVDANIVMKEDLNEVLNKLDLTSNNCIWIPQHPSRNCAYEESRVVHSIGKDKSDKPKKQAEKYKKEGFPTNFGLTQNSFIIRKQNDENCIKLMEMWFNELLENSHRDQLSLQYCEWKSGVSVYKLPKAFWADKYISSLQHSNTRRRNVTTQTQPNVVKIPNRSKYLVRKREKIIRRRIR